MSALAGCAVQGDVTAHHFGQATADRQAQAAATLAVAGLLEGLEQPRLHRRADAHAGVLHRQVEPHVPLAGVALGDAHHHLTHIGELDGVGQQVGQNLPQALRVARQPARHVMIDDAHQLKVLLVGQRCQQGGDVFDHLVNGEPLFVEVQAARLDTAPVQQVIDHGQQPARRPVQGFEVLLLLGVQGRAPQQIGVSQNAGEGRAQFVAEIGEQGRLAFGGRLRVQQRRAHVAVQRLQPRVLALEPGGGLLHELVVVILGLAHGAGNLVEVQGHGGQRRRQVTGRALLNAPLRQCAPGLRQLPQPSGQVQAHPDAERQRQRGAQQQQPQRVIAEPGAGRQPAQQRDQQTGQQPGLDHPEDAHRRGQP